VGNRLILPSRPSGRGCPEGLDLDFVSFPDTFDAIIRAKAFMESAHLTRTKNKLEHIPCQKVFNQVSFPPFGPRPWTAVCLALSGMRKVSAMGVCI
jgi:hypothetical protein